MPVLTAHGTDGAAALDHIVKKLRDRAAELKREAEILEANVIVKKLRDRAAELKREAEILEANAYELIENADEIEQYAGDVRAMVRTYGRIEHAEKPLDTTVGSDGLDISTGVEVDGHLPQGERGQPTRVRVNGVGTA